MADVLDTGPPRPPARRRRWVTTAGAAVLAGVAALLAARSNPEPAAPRAGPTVTAPVARGPSDAVVVAVAVGTRAVYALAARCDNTAAPVCSYRLHRRPLGDGRWRPLPWAIGPRRGVGLAPLVSVTAGEVVSVVATLDPPQVHTSTDDGLSVTVRPVAPGPPAAALTSAVLLDPGACPGCADRLTVLEPTTGRTRPLLRQPPLRSRRRPRRRLRKRRSRPPRRRTRARQTTRPRPS